MNADKHQNAVNRLKTLWKAADANVQEPYLDGLEARVLADVNRPRSGFRETRSGGLFGLTPESLYPGALVSGLATACLVFLSATQGVDPYVDLVNFALEESAGAISMLGF